MKQNVPKLMRYKALAMLNQVNDFDIKSALAEINEIKQKSVWLKQRFQVHFNIMILTEDGMCRCFTNSCIKVKLRKHIVLYTLLYTAVPETTRLTFQMNLQVYCFL